MKKRLALLFALMMLFSSVAIATAEEDPKGGLTLPLVDEPTTLTMLFGSSYDVTKDTWFFQQIKERTGIQIEPLAFSKDVSNEKYSTFIASGELPDICVVSSPTIGERNMYGDQGALASPDDYLDIMPNFKRIFYDDAQNNALYKQYAAESGKNYYLPVYRLNRDVNFGFMYRADILKELGLEPWTDSDSFYDALVAMKKAYPDSYPYANKGGGATMLARWASYWDVNGLPHAYDYDKSEWYIGATSEGFRGALDFLKKMYTDELLDPDFLTDSLDSWTAKYLNNKAFVMNDWIGRMALLNTQAAEVTPGFDLVYGLPPGNGKMQELALFTEWGVEVAVNKNTEASLKLLDYLYSPEGSELNTIGAEGVNFEWDENGKPVYPEFAGEDVDIVKLEEKYGLWIEGLYVHPDRRSVYYNFTPYEQAAQDLINSEDRYTKLPPYTGLVGADSEAFAILQTELASKTEAFAGNYIMNPEYGDAQWNEWVQSAMSEYGDAMLALLNK